MDQIFYSKKFMQEFGDNGEDILLQNEKFIYENIQDLLEGVVQQDWVKIYRANDGFKAVGKCSCANRLVEATRPLFRSLFKHRKPYTNEVPVDFKVSLDDEAKLQAMDFCRPIFEEARLLRLEMSKYTNSEVQQDIYLKEIQQIKELHENMKKQYQKQQSESQTNNSVITKLDKPENASCTEKCIIF